MAFFLGKGKRPNVAEQAAASREDQRARRAAWIAVFVYNVIGLLDIYSTSVGIAIGAAEEANPVMRLAMDHLGTGWIAAKLFLQLAISAMVLWFPHRIVLAIFLAAVAFNASVVWGNLRIAGIL